MNFAEVCNGLLFKKQLILISQSANLSISKKIYEIKNLLVAEIILWTYDWDDLPQEIAINIYELYLHGEILTA